MLPGTPYTCWNYGTACIPQPELPGCTVHCLAFADERLMNAALENGRSGGSPIPVRLGAALLPPHGAVAAAFRQLVLHAPRRVVDTRRELEKLDAAFHFEVICAVCAPYRAAFALETAQVQAKKAIWQLDPYASNRDYQAPGGYPRELELLNHLAACLITGQAVGDYAPGAPLAAAAEKVHVLDFPSLVPPAAVPRPMQQTAKSAACSAVLCIPACGSRALRWNFSAPWARPAAGPDDGRRRLAILCRGRCPDQGCIGRTV